MIIIEKEQFMLNPITHLSHAFSRLLSSLRLWHSSNHFWSDMTRIVLVVGGLFLVIEAIYLWHLLPLDWRHSLLK
jgi:hypothetical protein